MKISCRVGSTLPRRLRRPVANRALPRVLLVCLVVATATATSATTCGGDLEGGQQYIQQWTEPCEYTFVAENPVMEGGTLAQYFKVEFHSDFVPRFTLLDPDGNRVSPDEWMRSERFGGGWMISGEVKQQGLYRLRVGSDQGTGRLILSGGAQFRQPRHYGAARSGCIGGTIRVGSTSKTLSRGTGRCGFHYIGMAGDSLTISVTSDQVDPKVEISFDGAVLASNDDSGGSNSLISKLALSQSGSYDIEVTSRNAANGNFTIELSTD